MAEVSPEVSEIADLTKRLDALVPNARKGLPQDVFYFISRLTPMVNVDLLIKNEKNQTLLTWRRDEFYNGWHIAGGIVRFKELFADRLHAVAKQEFGATIDFDPAPIGTFEKINTSRDIRGHFIANLFRCRLTSPLDESMRCHDPLNAKHGQWYWHSECPKELIPQHEVYRKYIDP